jgi:hypothetical protein
LVSQTQFLNLFRNWRIQVSEELVSSSEETLINFFILTFTLQTGRLRTWQTINFQLTWKITCLPRRGRNFVVILNLKNLWDAALLSLLLFRYNYVIFLLFQWHFFNVIKFLDYEFWFCLPAILW